MRVRSAAGLLVFLLLGACAAPPPCLPVQVRREAGPRGTALDARSDGQGGLETVTLGDGALSDWRPPWTFSEAVPLRTGRTHFAAADPSGTLVIDWTARDGIRLLQLGGPALPVQPAAARPAWSRRAGRLHARGAVPLKGGGAAPPGSPAKVGNAAPGIRPS